MEIKIYTPDLAKYLMPLKLWYVYNHITESYLEREIYGYLLLMKIFSKGQIMALNAKIYDERVNPMGKLVLTDSNSLLEYEETELLVFIFMNRYYM